MYHNAKLTPGKKVKCASIVGDTIGKYSPQLNGVCPL